MARLHRLGRVLLVVSASILALASSASAQNRDVAFDAVRGQADGLPHLPPEGAWGEIINATSRWIVVQNHQGQQFPIAIEDIQEFLVRWPYSVSALTEQSVIEVAGQDAGSNVVRVSHIDAFEGADRGLVGPAYNQILPNNMVVTTLDPGFNRFMNAWDYAGQNLLYGWAYPVPPNVTGIPNRLHVVGPVIGRLSTQDDQVAGLRVGLPGNNFATIVSDGTGRLTVTQITRGDARFIKKGDYVFLMPLQITAKGLVLSQLVLYKQMPKAQFDVKR